MAKFHCVCVGGIQVGKPVDTVEDAERAMSLLAMDGVIGTSMTVETYEQAEGGQPVPSTPFYSRGRWQDELPRALPKAA